MLICTVDIRPQLSGVGEPHCLWARKRRFTYGMITAVTDSAVQARHPLASISPLSLATCSGRSCGALGEISWLVLENAGVVTFATLILGVV